LPDQSRREQLPDDSRADQDPGKPMPILLQSTVGGFSNEFRRKLPLVEKAMIAHGLDPAQFVISKDQATPPSVPWVGPFFYAYTVFVDDDHFTVTEPNDTRFLDYFYKRCIAEEEPLVMASGHSLHIPQLISRLFNWMSKPV
jgi:hypothetical protein